MFGSIRPSVCVCLFVQNQGQTVSCKDVGWLYSGGSYQVWEQADINRECPAFFTFVSYMNGRTQA